MPTSTEPEAPRPERQQTDESLAAEREKADLALAEHLAVFDVSVEHVEDGLRFSVRDTGIGLPPNKLEAVFQRYLQVSTNDRRGVGLGLYISRCIVLGHGGRIWVESKLGAGSTFRFTIPLAPPA